MQYPGEKEITFPPFTCLEADGEPRLERTKEGEVVIFPLKVAHPTQFTSISFFTPPMYTHACLSAA